MAKYPFSNETKDVLNDLENRIIQLVEVNAIGRKKNQEIVENQERAFNSVLTLIKQIRVNGQIERGSGAAPDPIEPLATTKWVKPQRLL